MGEDRGRGGLRPQLRRYVATAVVDRVPKRVRAVVFADAFVAVDGRNSMDMTPAWRAAEVETLVRSEGWFVPPAHSERYVADPLRVSKTAA